MFDKLITPMLDNILATYGMTRADVYQLKNEVEIFLGDVRVQFPGLVARFEALEKAIHTQTIALEILLDAHNKQHAYINEQLRLVQKETEERAAGVQMEYEYD